MKSESADNLFVMADGTNVTSKGLMKGDDGVLRNKSGVAVALDGEGKPMTVGETAVAGGNAAAAKAGATQADDAQQGRAGAPNESDAPRESAKRAGREVRK